MDKPFVINKTNPVHNYTFQFFLTLELVKFKSVTEKDTPIDKNLSRATGNRKTREIRKPEVNFHLRSHQVT